MLVNNSALQLNRIGFDNANPNQIRQISFSFNQDIALLGSTPSLAQINAINMPALLKSDCAWRFVKLSVLACELSSPIRPFTEFRISIDDSFTALGKKLALEGSVQNTALIRTSLPPINVRIGKTEEFMPRSFEASEYFNQTQDDNNEANKALYQQLYASLMLKTPSGDLLPLAVTVTRQNDRSIGWSIQFSPSNNTLYSGDYALVLPKNFSPTANNSTMPFRTLAQEQTIFSFNYQKAFMFHGLMCRDNQANTRNNKPFYPIHANANNIVECAPEQLSFAFSRPLHETNMLLNIPSQLNRSKQTLLPWLVGPAYTWQHLNITQNIYYYSVALQGNSQYQVLLNALESASGERLEQQSEMAFKTSEASPFWQFPWHGMDVIETQEQALPYIYRRNVEQITQTLSPIKSASDLLTYLNKQSLEGKTSTLAPTQHTVNKKGRQNIALEPALNNESGLVLISLSGQSQEHAISPHPYTANGKLVKGKDFPPVHSDTRLINSAAFNLLVSNSNSLVLQAIDWQANHLAQVKLSLVCSGQANIVDLGITNQQGILYLDYKDWANIYAPVQEETCWLWAENGQQTAAIALPSQSISLKQAVIAYAYTAQPVYEPGDTVHIGLLLKQRDFTQANKALMPISSIEGFSLKINAPNSKTVLANVALNELSANGMSSATFTLPNNAPVGNYAITLFNQAYEQQTPVAEWLTNIGQIRVNEFTPPEFEQSISLPQKKEANWIEYGQTLQAEIQARRLNGGILRNAKVSTVYDLIYARAVPKSWPENYVYHSWEDYHSYPNFDPIRQQHKLDSKGSLTYESMAIKSPLPLATISFSSEVSADDGETQVISDDIFYMSHEHYIGSKINAKENEISLIAINKHGEALTQVPAQLKFYKRVNSQKNEWTLVNQCKSKTMPFVCDIPTDHAQLKIEIISGTQGYTTTRRYYRPAPPKENDNVRYPTLSVRYMPSNKASDEATNQHEIEVTAGKTISLEVDSNITGTATLIVHSGTIQKVWQRKVSVGKQTIHVDIDPSWFPSATISLSMPVSKTIIAQLAKDIATSSHLASSAISALHHNGIRRPNDNINNLNRYRLLRSQFNLRVKPKEITPQLTITTLSDSVRAGGKLTLNLQANTALESQLWLVNDGILALSNTYVSDYDPSDYLQWQSQAYNMYDSAALSDSLISKFGADVGNQAEAFALEADVGIRMRAPAPNAPLSPKRSQGQASKLSKADFAQSVWLKSVSLQANESHSITLQLPKLIGRWKIIALNTTPQQSTVSSASINTTQAVEYFLDLPTTILANDKATLAITQINNTNQHVTDQLTLWINSETRVTGQTPKSSPVVGQTNFNLEQANTETKTKALRTWPVELSKRGGENSYQRTTYVLPQLEVGKYSLFITSANDQQFAAYADIQVFENTYKKQQTWLVSPESPSTQIKMPRAAIPDSIAITRMNSGGDTPNWQAISAYNKEYPYSGWEQTLSRAISYNYTPDARIHWPQGQSVLQDLLDQEPAYNLGDGNFRYFNTVSSSNFLSAYILLANAWLKDTRLSLNIDTQASIQKMKTLLENKHTQHHEPLTLSMALLALAANKAIKLEDALKYLQNIGRDPSRNSSQAQVLQALSLRWLEAPQALVNQAIEQLQHNHYIDTNNSLFNQNAYKCFAAMAYGTASSEYASLTKEVVAQQLQLGHFGSPLANAICSYSLRNNSHSETPENLSFIPEDDNLVLSNNDTQNYWLSLQYKQALFDVRAEAMGIDINRHLEVFRNGQWEAIQQTHLEIGDLVKTSLRVSSPIARHQIAISDAIAGGFEALQANFSNQRYKEDYSRSWFHQNKLEIKDGKAFWYVHYLAKGEQDFVYYSRVRHSGTYTIAPAHVQALYRTDVKANTAANQVHIQGEL